MGWRLHAERCWKKFEELAENAKGIKRIAVLRADVDNLGTTFVHGFKRGDDDKYVTLSRTAALSRHLSLFSRATLIRYWMTIQNYYSVMVNRERLSLYIQEVMMSLSPERGMMLYPHIWIEDGTGQIYHRGIDNIRRNRCIHTILSNQCYGRRNTGA